MPTATHRGTTKRRLAVVGGLVLAIAVLVTPIQWYAGYRAVQRVGSTVGVRPTRRTPAVGVDDRAVG
jgi:hypothetical protein